MSMSKKGESRSYNTCKLVFVLVEVYLVCHMLDFSEANLNENSLAEVQTDNKFTTDILFSTTNSPYKEDEMGIFSIDTNITNMNQLDVKTKNIEDKNLFVTSNNKTVSHKLKTKEENNEILERINIFPKIDIAHIELLDSVNLTADNASSTLEQHIRNSVNSEIQSEQSIGTAIGEVLEDIEPEVRQTLAEDLLDVKYPQKRFLSGLSNLELHEGSGSDFGGEDASTDSTTANSEIFYTSRDDLTIMPEEEESFNLQNETLDGNEAIMSNHSEISNEVDSNSSHEDEKKIKGVELDNGHESFPKYKSKLDSVEDFNTSEWMLFDSKKKGGQHGINSNKHLDKLIDSNIRNVENDTTDNLVLDNSFPHIKNKSDEVITESNTLEMDHLDALKNISIKSNMDENKNEKETDNLVNNLDTTKKAMKLETDELSEMEHNENLVPQEDAIYEDKQVTFASKHVPSPKSEFAFQYSTTEDSMYVSTTDIQYRTMETLNHSISDEKKFKLETETENVFQETTTSLPEDVISENKDSSEAANATSETLPTTNKDSRSLNENPATIFYEALLPKAAGRTFHENVVASHNVIGNVETENSKETSPKSQLVTVIAFCSVTMLILVTFSLTICLKKFHRQHGTLDIEMQEQHCGKDDLDDEEAETKIKLLNPVPQLPSFDNDD